MSTIGHSILRNTELLDLKVGTIIIDKIGGSARIGYQLGIGKTVVLQDANGNQGHIYSLVPAQYNEHPPLPMEVTHEPGDMVIIWTP